MQKSKRKFWAEKEKDIIQTKYPTSTRGVMEKLLPDRTWDSIKAMAKKMKVRRISLHIDQIKSNPWKLLEDTPEALYWVGFILADGYISKTNRLQIGLSIKDLGHLKKFAKFIEKETVCKSQCGAKCSIAVMHQDAIAQLKNKYQISHNKTICPPDPKLFDSLPDKLFWPLVIGFIDGDGCIQNQTNRTDFRISIKCHSSWVPFLELVAKKLPKAPQPYINNSGYANLSIASKKSVSFLRTESLKIHNSIMHRKWDKISYP